jgi:hypothetical protein
MNPFPFACGSFKFLGSSAIGGGGGAGDTNSGQTIPTYNLRNPSKLNGLAAPNQVGIGAGGPPAPPNGAAGAPIVPSPSTTGPGRVRAGLQFALGGNPGVVVGALDILWGSHVLLLPVLIRHITVYGISPVLAELTPEQVVVAGLADINMAPALT